MRTFNQTLMAVVAAGGLLVASAPSASAGDGTKACTLTASVAGSSSVGSAKTWQTSSGACGSVKVSASYVRAGSGTWYDTGTKTGPLSVATSPGGIKSSSHGVPSPGMAYSSAKSFSLRP